MLKVRQLTVRFGGLTAVRQVDLDIAERGIFALVGPNGAGKTTVLGAVSRVCPISGGTILLDGIDVLRLRSHEVMSVGIARSFQRAELFPTLTVLENLLVGLHARTRTGLEGAFFTRATRSEEERSRERAERLLRELDLWELRDQCPADLPYGHQKVLDVARALVSEPKLLLLDEPFSGLTEAETPLLLSCITEAGKCRAVLMVEHHFELLEGIADRITVINFGSKIAEGSPAEIRTDPEVVRCYLGTGRASGAAEAVRC